jgi:arylsulfatase A-like enzyme
MPLHRRTFLQTAIAAPLALCATRPQPNVILIITDDQGYGDLSCHGNPVLKTPHLDQLHSRSIRFTNFHVSPTCAPTRSALLTGRYNNATGVWHTIMGRSLLARDEVTLADCFRASGYRTGIFGKWHLGDNYPCRPQDRGFDETLICGGGGVWQTPDFFGNDYTDDTYLRNGRPERKRGFCTDVFFESARQFIERSSTRRQPFFCYLPTNAPHSPMWAPESYSRRFRDLAEPGFFGMIANIDDNVGKLLAFLRRRQLEENTLVIFTTDNGTSSGARLFNAGMRGQKGSPYDGGHRVPLFLHWPKVGMQGGRDVEALTAHIDLLPTLTELCGLRRPQGPPLHGTSLAPLLDAKRTQWPQRSIVVDSQRGEKLVKWRQAAVMTDRWRLVNPTPDGRPNALELYDIAADPSQRNNVASEHPETLRRLAQHYDEWWNQTSQRNDEYVRIVLGNDRENPSCLTAHDWHGAGAEAVWNQMQIRKAPAANGFWTVDIERAGRYRIELRRWPRELDLPINAPYTDPAPNREQTPGAPISAIRARLLIEKMDQTVPVNAGDRAATFTLPLPRGPASLQTWFYGSDGTERGAYYVYVERIEH